MVHVICFFGCWVDFRKSGLYTQLMDTKGPISEHTIGQGGNLGALSTDTAGELDILGHDGDTLGVDSAQVRILEKTYEVRLGSLLKGKDGRSLESEVALEVLGDLTNETLEGELADQKIGRLLVTTDLTKGNGSYCRGHSRDNKRT